MRFVTDNRASRILYNFLSTKKFEKPIVVPLNVCEVVPSVFCEAEVEFVFADIDSSTLCLDLDWVFSNINQFSGIFFVHTYGTEHSYENSFREIKKHDPGFVIVDDRCLCMPSLLTPETIADVCLFSVGDKKQVDLGIGGFAFLQENLKYEFSPLKPGSFLNDEFWGLDRSVFEKRAYSSFSHRYLINEVYRSSLPGEIQLEDRFQNWRFNIWVDNKEEVLKAIFAAGLFASSHYHPLGNAGDSTNAVQLHNHVINLFNDYHFSIEMAERTCSIINRMI